MSKPRVVFPYTEAGLGHIMPMNSIADEFEKLYGDKVEVVRSNFFTESGDKKLKKYERSLVKTVISYNKHPAVGDFATLNMGFWGSALSTWGAVVFMGRGAHKKGIAHMTELSPDLVVSTHYATNYYAMHMKNRPLTAMYCPDAEICALFRYKCDLTLVSMPTGYEKAKKKHKRRYKNDDIRQVPFLIRKEAFDITTDKKELRRGLGIDENKFTILLADGGYGVGKSGKLCKEIIKRDLPVNLLMVCGKNKKLYESMKNIKSKGNTSLYPFEMAENILELIACSDLTCGKSGASLMAEPCFFGVPSIITHYACDVERCIGKYYINTVGSAVKQFKVKKAANLIEKFLAYPALLQPHINAAHTQRQNYGANKCARYIFGLLCKRFPELKDGTELY